MMDETKPTIPNVILAGTIGGGSILWWLDKHAAGLGALAAITGLLVAGLFHVLHYVEKKRHNRAIEGRKMDQKK